LPSCSAGPHPRRPVHSASSGSWNYSFFWWRFKVLLRRFASRPWRSALDPGSRPGLPSPLGRTCLRTRSDRRSDPTQPSPNAVRSVRVLVSGVSSSAMGGSTRWHWRTILSDVPDAVFVLCQTPVVKHNGDHRGLCASLSTREKTREDCRPPAFPDEILGAPVRGALALRGVGRGPTKMGTNCRPADRLLGHIPGRRHDCHDEHARIGAYEKR
jgi:hypothetical protein